MESKVEAQVIGMRTEAAADRVRGRLECMTGVDLVETCIRTGQVNVYGHDLERDDVYDALREIGCETLIRD
ncbi:hypothetical protein H8711_10100 [Clostridiaceae bacterium NSJ-31]|uniref:HMA domain-containing protein n=1 Tax=Ligaoa zhengdingensis TaxID=2763658 RepID=A0A926E1W2_9FIRM|nr:hypothetical protein [Ligaoa zhengdingensis]MBC8547275.1 hypothetical protein [Ligaoa zhengdingensis]